jgi:hypothetical protein
LKKGGLMYVTAHHVVRPGTNVEGINAFCYRHGSHLWAGLPPAGIPDENPGELAASSAPVRPGGNHVRSYLDIMMPDEVPWTEVRASFVAFLSEAQRRDFPWEGVIGRCTFRVGLELDLASTWQHEVALLLQAAQGVHGQAGPA